MKPLGVTTNAPAKAVSKTTSPKLSKLIFENGFKTNIEGYYYCTNFTCLAPTPQFETLIEQIR